MKLRPVLDFMDTGGLVSSASRSDKTLYNYSEDSHLSGTSLLLVVWSLASSLILAAYWSEKPSEGNKFHEPAGVKINEQLYKIVLELSAD